MAGSEFSTSEGLEYVLFFVVAGLAVFAVHRARLRSSSPVTPLLLGTLGACLVFAALWLPSEPSVPELQSPEQNDDQGYVSSQTCRSCHPGKYDSWYSSYHRTMTQVASPEAIVAPHQSVSLVGGSRRFNVEFKDGEMFVDDVKQWKAYWHFTNKGPILPEDFPRVSGQVVMTTGSHHMQLYWIKLEDGGLEQLSWTWLIRDQRWVPGEMVYLQPPDGPAGLTGTWELNCIKCCLLYTSPSPRDQRGSRMPSSA